ncbi:MAG: 1-acyl-sn-glycerol-3-phosphate acyltransferase [Bacteroidetes bacterium]|jgi:1-acyl-sn-glycerol-3-phosphate acyltransferase|nr:MAG: 1-acyl-sn-glycerol-3-phosphate acyltransferase [Bacteroidota bacterium]
MNFIKNILGRIFAFWALIVFVVTMLVFFIPIWIASLQKEPRRTIVFQKVSRVWMRLFFILSGIRISIKGKENFKTGENYVVVCNHNSMMDVPLTTPFVPGANKTIAKIEMAKIPLFGLIYRTGSVLVDRKSEESRKNSYVKMKEVLDMGLDMCIYPEGTRNKTSEPLQRFHNGAFRLAIDAGKPILPAVIFNTARVLPINKTFFLWPVKIKMHFLEPIAPASLTVEELKDKVFFTMRDYYVKHKDQ